MIEAIFPRLKTPSLPREPDSEPEAVDVADDPGRCEPPTDRAGPRTWRNVDELLGRLVTFIWTADADVEPRRGGCAQQDENEDERRKTFH
jgi:hypothetical protein